MTIPIQADPVPMNADADGIIRIAHTRIPLETLVTIFNAGATPEEIAVRFDALKLADIYAVIAFCLSHPTEVASYMAERDHAATQTQQSLGAQQNGPEIRARLISRYAKGA